MQRLPSSGWPPQMQVRLANGSRFSRREARGAQRSASAGTRGWAGARFWPDRPVGWRKASLEQECI